MAALLLLIVVLPATAMLGATVHLLVDHAAQQHDHPHDHPGGPGSDLAAFHRGGSLAGDAREHGHDATWTVVEGRVGAVDDVATPGARAAIGPAAPAMGERAGSPAAAARSSPPTQSLLGTWLI